MPNVRSTIGALRRRLASALCPELQARAVELAELSEQASHQLEAWRSWGSRLIMAERWARAAAEHEHSQWRPLLSAYAIAALLVDELSELEPVLLEQAAAIDEMSVDPETGLPAPTPAQQVAIVARAALEELRAISGPHRETVLSRLQPGAARTHDTIWDPEKLGASVRGVVSCAYAASMLMAAERLKPDASAVSSGKELS